MADCGHTNGKLRATRKLLCRIDERIDCTNGRDTCSRRLASFHGGRSSVPQMDGAGMVREEAKA